MQAKTTPPSLHPGVEAWEIEHASYNALSEIERGVVDVMMDGLVDVGRANGMDLWLLNPRANATREKLSQWLSDRRKTSTPGSSLPSSVQP